MEIEFHIQGKGHCPAFKNKKMIARGRLITQPKVRQWMDSVMRDMLCTLKSLYQTTGGETSMECWQQFATCSLAPDDRWQKIPLKVIRVRKVPKGEEGLLIKLRKIQN